MEATLNNNGVPLARIVSSDEYERLWKPIRDKVFAPGTGNIDLPDDSPFLRDDWTRIALPYSFWSGRYEKPVGFPDPTGTAEDEYLDDRPNIFATALELGAKEIFVSGEPVQVEEYVAFHPSVEGADAVFATGFDGRGLPPLVFDNTGLWGLTSYFEDNGILAGAPEFMERYLDRIGGLEYAKYRFYAYDIETGWCLYSNKKEVILPFYAMIGWDPPRYPDGDPRAS